MLLPCLLIINIISIDRTFATMKKGWCYDFCIWDFKNYQGIPYYLATTPVYKVFKKGKMVWEFEI